MDHEIMTPWSQEVFLKSSIPMLVFDITDIRKKCKELQRTELNDIDKYIDEELFLKQYGYSHLKIHSINKSALDLFCFSEKEEVERGMSISYNSIHENVRQLILNKIFDEKTNIVYEYSGTDCFDNYIKYKLFIDFIEYDDILLSLISIFDVSSYKKSESILTEFVEKYYLLLKTIKDAILIVDIYSGLILEANDKAVDLFKVRMTRLIGEKHTDFFSSDEKLRYEQFFKKRIYEDQDSDETINIFIDQGDNNFIPVQVKINAALVGNLRVAQILLYDMSNRFKMEEGRRLLATAVDQVAESVVITDVYGAIQYVNPAFEDISGYSYTEMLGKNPRILQSGETPPYHYKLMWEEISAGNVWRGTFINRKKTGEIYKEEATITPVKDNNDSIISYVAVKRDITQHLLLENQIRQSQKMQAIGTLAGGVAHDFNNILTAIMGYAELSQSQCDEKTLLYNNLSEIIRGADRAGKLVDQILKFSRQSEKSVSSLKLSLIVKEVFKLLRASLPANIELVSEYRDNLFVKADPTQMHQIVMNLCTNAYQALEGKGGFIKLRLFQKKLLPKEGVIIGNLPQGSYVCLQVEDNGIGIPPEYLQRVFEPYFTTKKLHEGTGLGLSVVHGIVNDHGGAVTAESVPGRGSRLTVYLPEAEEDFEDSKYERESSYSNSEGNILVVDDEQPITFFLVQVLEHLGYKVVACVSSEAAYEMFLKKKEEFDLVITDMGMPGMTGLELSEKIKKINPNIPIMLCTGFSEHVTAENYKQMGLSGFVSKPFNAGNLVREVTRILEESKK
ncbi:response regulator [uncultured Desulfobulbus sp.]|uniref:hybrid sensor histidine kinase/response regulator n=1 Tax=uncultured Desulfobulbus sp. TaxID=239745 RepID=UPI0029C83A96|nr:response regulator [uncultured Desulfobulbus sp.]